MANLVTDKTIALAELEKRRRHYSYNLYDFATEICGYDLLTEDFHRPMLDGWDLNNKLRDQGKRTLYELDMWPRYYYKTTCKKARRLQFWLRHHDGTAIWWHAVEDRAKEEGEEIAGHILKNKEYRRLFPAGILPSPARKLFYSGGVFKLEPRRYSSTPSFRTFGAKSEATGGHSDEADLDDIIGMNTVFNNEMPKIRFMFGSTVMNVVKPGGSIHAVGTHWDPNDIYVDWRKAPDWACRVRAAYETDGKPDIKGEPVLFTREEIELKARNMSHFVFMCQMMNDPVPAEDVLWKRDYEHFCDKKEARRGSGTTFVLSDSAPIGGGHDSKREKERADGTKDDWAVLVVRVRVIGNRQDIIILDGDFSKEWTADEGYRRCCMFSHQYRTPYIADEKVGSAGKMSSGKLHDISLQLGIRGITPVDLQWTYQGKKNYWQHYCSRAARGEVLISEECPQHVVDKLLDQSRSMRFHPTGRVAIPFDDLANVASFSVDPELQRYSPQPDYPDDLDNEDEYDDQRVSKYCAY